MKLFWFAPLAGASLKWGVADWGSEISLGAKFYIQPPGHLIFFGCFPQSHFLFVCFTWKSTFALPKPGLPFSMALIKHILLKWNVLRVSAFPWPGCLCVLHNHICRRYKGPRSYLQPQDPGLILRPGEGPQPAPRCPLKQQLAEAVWRC